MPVHSALHLWGAKRKCVARHHLTLLSYTYSTKLLSYLQLAEKTSFDRSDQPIALQAVFSVCMQHWHVQLISHCDLSVPSYPMKMDFRIRLKLTTLATPTPQCVAISSLRSHCRDIITYTKIKK